MISIIIPVLNEQLTIEKLLTHLSESSGTDSVLEVLVVDGGSTDGTQELVRHCTSNGALHTVLIPSEKGRARQMNLGASMAKGSILYFLHADSLPPKNFDKHILAQVNQGADAGCFRMKFDSNHPILKVSQWFTRFNYKICRGGDQSLFITRKVFDSLKGFNEAYTIYEDCEFINRIYDSYSFSVLDDYLITSARKYEKNGALKLQYHFTVIHLKKMMGATPQDLNAYYLKNISS